MLLLLFGKSRFSAPDSDQHETAMVIWRQSHLPLSFGGVDHLCIHKV